MSDTPTYNAPLAGTPYEKLIWGNLLHLSFNMWGDRVAPERKGGSLHALPHLLFDDALWNDLLRRMQEAGMNMVVIDLGDGVLYDSHPEIAVENAWSTERLRDELAKMRQMGLEPIPKLNFSTAHDTWLKDYGRMVSTPTYYRVCSNLIRECLALFDGPRFFHLGMDEETAGHQRHFAFAAMRQYELWWHDLNFLRHEVTTNGSRPWVWSDYMWEHRAEYLEKMPKTVLQSNWYYKDNFDETVPVQESDPFRHVKIFKSYNDLEANGYDQIPTGSNWLTDTNFALTVDYALKHIAPERLLGFLTAPWHPTIEARRPKHLDAIAQVEAVIQGLAAKGA